MGADKEELSADDADEEGIFCRPWGLSGKTMTVLVGTNRESFRVITSATERCAGGPCYQCDFGSFAEGLVCRRAPR